MRQLDLARMEFRLTPGATSVGQLVELCSLLESQPEHAGWEWLRFAPEQLRHLPVQCSLEDALQRVLDGTWRVLVGTRANGGATEQLAVAYGPPLYKLWLEVNFLVKLGEELLQPTFESACQVLRPTHACFLPDYVAADGKQEQILEMALQRGFSIFGFEPEDATVLKAREIAPLLPRLRSPMPDPSTAPERIGWINYWSADVARTLSLSVEPQEHWVQAMTPHIEPGSWIFKLTATPLDLSIPANVEAIAKAYWLFTSIGHRMNAVRNPDKGTKPSTAPKGTRPVEDYAIRERDTNGNWWTAAATTIRAETAEEALRVHFAQVAHGRRPRPRESLSKLRDRYDELASEVGLTPSHDIDACLKAST